MTPPDGFISKSCGSRPGEIACDSGRREGGTLDGIVLWCRRCGARPPDLQLLCRALADNGPPCAGKEDTMKQAFLTLVTAGAVGLGAGIALAGTPLPNPPFTSGGFVPPDSFALKQELAVGKLLTKYAVGRAKCDRSALIALQLAYEPPGAPKVPEVQLKWTACQTKNADKYVVGRDKLLLNGTPPCLDQAGIDGIKAQIDAQFPGLGAIVYCDGDAAAPDPVTGLNIPDFKNEAEGEVAAAKVVTLAGTRAGKCYMNAVKYAFKYGGTIPAEVLAKIDACFAKVAAGGAEAMDKLDQTQKLPACLPLATAQGLVTATINLAGQFNDENYCASPSGAFVAGDDAR
jgi:hypothetical protein